MKALLTIVASFLKSLVYSSKERTIIIENIGWHITIPAGFRNLKKNEILHLVKRQNRKKKQRLPDLEMKDYCDRVLLLAMDFEKNYLLCRWDAIAGKSSTSIADEYDNVRRKIVEEYKTQYKEYSRVSLEHYLGSQSIGTVLFDRSNIHIRTPERILAQVFLYHSIIKGKEILITVYFQNAAKAEKLIKAVEESEFGV